MEPPMNRLSFATLREANIARLPLFKNAQGEPAHTERDGSDWSPADWMVATLGELGEAANIMKKMRRGDYGDRNEDAYIEAEIKLEKEFADVATYLDIMAMQFGIDLGKVVQDKWNEVSARIDCPLEIHFDILIDTNEVE